MERIVTGDGVVVIYESVSTVEGLMERHRDREAAITAALESGAHLHDEDNDTDARYVVCNDAACEEG